MESPTPGCPAASRGVNLEFNTEKLSNTCDVSVDVMIIGAGPVGLTSALLLQQHGINTVILEKHPGTSIHPKARGISCRSMELFRKLSIEDQVKQFNLPKSQTWFGWFSQLTGKLYERVFSNTDYQSISPSEPATAAQQYLEKIMLAQFKKQGGNILFQHQVVHVAQNDQVIQAVTKNSNTQQQTVFQAKYLIAADGAHSTIQQMLKIPMIGPEKISVNYSIFCEIDLDHILDQDKRFGIAFIIRPGKPAPMVLSIDGKKRWVFIFPSAGAPADVLKTMYTDEYIKTQISDVIGQSDCAINIISKQIWSLGSQVANQFIAGRILLAGDCIHRFSPTGGMGMNTGLQDADNLIWKLAYVIQGKAHPRILQSYTQERLPSVLNNMEWSLKNLRRIIKIQRGFEEKELNEANIQKLVQGQQAHLNKSGLDLGVIYQSALISESNQPKPTMPTDLYTPTTFPGSRLPHFELLSQGSIISSLDLISTQFTLLCLDQCRSYISNIDFSSIPTQVIFIGENEKIREINQGEFKTLAGLNEFASIWIRPDGHIAWKGCLNNESDINPLKEIITFMHV